MEKPATIYLWTIQPIEVWERLQQEGELYTDPTHPRFMGIDPGDPAFPGLGAEFRDSYDWMREQMARRLPGYGGHYPWWALEDYKYDLRTHRHLKPLGEIWVRIELRVPVSEVLLSAYGDWHCVLGRDYLPENPEQWETEKAAREEWEKTASPDEIKRTMIASWERIFDVEARREWNTMQACFECMRLRDVIRVTEYRGTSKRL